MVELTQQQFREIVAEGIDAIPKKYQDHLNNVAFIVEDEPSEEQRVKLQLRQNESLFGLYEGLPLTARQGTMKLLPDKITLFKRPLELSSRDIDDLRERVARTIWHEVAHYFGLDHSRINELEK